jgi:type I restriction enzyme S subunit
LGNVRASALVAIGQCNLNPTRYGATVVALPPPDEQAAITHALDEAIQAIDVLIEKARDSIDLMCEHRSALISAAVTGKIDVRDEATVAASEELASV